MVDGFVCCVGDEGVVVVRWVVVCGVGVVGVVMVGMILWEWMC